MHKRILSLLLLLATVFSIFTLASCGEREETPVATTTATETESGSDDATTANAMLCADGKKFFFVWCFVVCLSSLRFVSLLYI